MAQLHALVDAPRGVVVDAAIFHVVLRLAQCFAADIPATVCIIFDDRYKSFLTISLKYSRVRSVASVPLRLPDLAAEAAVLHGAQRRRRRLPAAGANPVALS